MTGKVAFCGASTYGISKKTKGGASHELSDSGHLLDRQGIYYPDRSPHAVYPVPEVPPHKALDAPHHAAVPGLQGSGDPVSGTYLLRRIHLHTGQL